ncbi:hypothetical protein D5086_014538 [Populus alba]|uniref:Uncharacterized protein n=2 Tax=Populus TaxID=3689 RepID=A0ACC4BZ89_POPAL|nr:hypothetical protein NC653_018387 [Populus alba x Populus x berolinensis]
MNHRRFLVTVSMLDMSAMVILNIRNCIVSTSGRGNGHACPHPTPDIIQNPAKYQAEQDEEKVAEFKQSMIAFFKIVRIDLGSHNVASPLLEGECIDVHPFIEGLAVCLFDLNSKIEWSIEDLNVLSMDWMRQCVDCLLTMTSPFDTLLFWMRKATHFA